MIRIFIITFTLVKTSWNYLFPLSTFFQIHSSFLDFRSRYCIFAVKKYYFQGFWIFVLLATLLALLMQHIWFGVYEIYAYLLGKFGRKI